MSSIPLIRFITRLIAALQRSNEKNNFISDNRVDRIFDMGCG